MSLYFKKYSFFKIEKEFPVIELELKKIIDNNKYDEIDNFIDKYENEYFISLENIVNEESKDHPNITEIKKDLSKAYTASIELEKYINAKNKLDKKLEVFK